MAVTAKRHAKPLVVSVRGMLEPAALQHRGWKKQIAWRLYQQRILDSAAALHVTSSLEDENVRVLGLRPRVITIPNGVNVPAACPDFAPPSSPSRVLFMGRVHPIKGLPMLLAAWERVHAQGWMLEIAGPDECGHLRDLRSLATSLGITETVTFVGAVAGREKAECLARAAVCVLPSHSENFGLAAAEALAAGRPVVATRATPWASLQTEHCGWHVPTSVDGLEEGLRAAIATPRVELAAMGARGHAFVARSYSWGRIAHEMVALYDSLVRR